ncbi:hypothetical protein M758_2G031000 [Ceratodon purpureus]|nr:hypothetical protein M758_2G031000 [Ceratodon purpureus]
MRHSIQRPRRTHILIPELRRERRLHRQPTSLHLSRSQLKTRIPKSPQHPNPTPPSHPLNPNPHNITKSSSYNQTIKRNVKLYHKATALTRRMVMLMLLNSYQS